MFKTGFKTSEFLVTLLVIVLANVQAVLVPDSLAGKVVALVASVLAALGYQGSRTRVKTNEAEVRLIEVAREASNEASVK